jgi:hypothetical protein
MINIFIKLWVYHWISSEFPGTLCSLPRHLRGPGCRSDQDRPKLLPPAQGVEAGDPAHAPGTFRSRSYGYLGTVLGGRGKKLGVVNGGVIRYTVHR